MSWCSTPSLSTALGNFRSALRTGLGDVEEVQRILGDGHDLGRGEGGGGGDSHDGTHSLAAHVLIEAVAGVLVALAAGVAVEGAQAHLHLVLLAEEGEQGLGVVAQVTLEGGDLGGQSLQRLVFGKPGLVAFEHVLQIPGKLLGNLAAFGDLVVVHGE